MSTTLTIELPVYFHRAGHGSRTEMRSGAETPALPLGRVPRVSRLMALALRFDELVRTGQVDSYSTLASLGLVTRARVSQIMNLLCLAPDLQEAFWVVRVDAALGALRRAIQRAAEYQGDTSRLSEQIALLRKARASEFEGDSQGADRFLAQALNGSSGDE